MPNRWALTLTAAALLPCLQAQAWKRINGADWLMYNRDLAGTRLLASDAGQYHQRF